jgi:hypothetical protein
MLLQKPVDMGWANLSRGDLPLREPSSEVCHDSAIQADGTGGVAPTAEIATEDLGNYVNLVARFLFMIAGTLKTDPPTCRDFNYTKVFVRQGKVWKLAAVQFANAESPRAKSSQTERRAR